MSEQMVTYHHGSFYKNFHLLTLNMGLKFFPGENVECESLNMPCAICIGFSLTLFRKVRKPFHYSNCFFSTWASSQFHHLRVSSMNKEGIVQGGAGMHRQGEMHAQCEGQQSIAKA